LQRREGFGYFHVAFSSQVQPNWRVNSPKVLTDIAPKRSRCLCEVRIRSNPACSDRARPMPTATGKRRVPQDLELVGNKPGGIIKRRRIALAPGPRNNLECNRKAPFGV
jgi:hypothetical protein